MMAKEPTHSWGHDALAADLANHLRGGGRMVWENMQLGPSGSPRPDVYSIARSYTRPSPIAYEVKISRSDFLKDTGAAKWSRYLDYAGGVMFACPAGLLAPADLPAGTGLMVRGDGWRVLRAPRLQSFDTMPRDAWLKLLIDGVHRLQPSANDAPGRGGWLAVLRADDKIRQRHGNAVAKVVGNADMRHREMDRLDGEVKAKRAAYQDAADELRALREKMAEVQAEAEARASARINAQHADMLKARADLCAVLGLPADAGTMVIHRRIHGLRDALTVDAARQRLARALQDIASMAAASVATEDKHAPVGE